MLPSTLITTKLHRPILPLQIIGRPHLLTRLEVKPGTKVTLVIAPAGSGKSTLLSSWIEELRRPAAWFSIDESDNDVRRFLLYMVSALQQTEERLGVGLLDILQTKNTVEAEPLIIRLINDAATLGQPLTLVLDDYHLITSGEIHAAVDFLLDHIHPNLHLVIASRTDPPLRIASLRAGGYLTELRTEQLRFSREEVAAFLNERHQLGLSHEEIVRLEERTEGWAAGLQLAAISLEGRSNKGAFVRKFAGSHRYLVDYLIDDVLKRQPLEIRQFLQRTSILERFTASLCDSLSDRPNSLKILRYLSDANLFLVALDDEGRWYRYHHLFAEFLRHRLAEEEGGYIPELHRRASTWFESRGWLDEAIDHALLADELERAGGLIEGIAFDLQNTFNNPQLVEYVAKFPLEMLIDLPKVGVYFGWALANMGRSALLTKALPVIEQSSERAEQPEVVAAFVLALRAFQCLWQMHFATGIKLCHDTIAWLNQNQRRSRTNEERWLLTSAHNIIAYCQFYTDLSAADRSYPKALALSVELGNYIGAANDFARHGWIKHQLGDSVGALTIFRNGLRDLAGWKTEGGRALNSGELHLNLSQLLYEWDRLEDADTHLQQAREFNQRSQFPPGIALTYETTFKLDLAHGRVEAAALKVGKLNALLGEVDPLNLLHAKHFGTAVQRMRLHLAAYDESFSPLLADVKAWVETQNLKADDLFDYPTEAGYVVLARLLLTQGETGAASSLLTRLEVAAHVGGRVYDHVYALSLLATAEHAQGRWAAAHAAMQHALALAEPRGYRRIFFDQGAQMRVLLERMVQRTSTPYVRNLLAAFPRRDTKAPDSPPIHPATPRSTPGNTGGLEPLNDREAAILRLLAAGHSNKSIAKQLGLSPNTIKWYLKGLFVKLGADGRVQAINRARGFGLV